MYHTVRSVGTWWYNIRSSIQGSSFDVKLWAVERTTSLLHNNWWHRLLWCAQKTARAQGWTVEALFPPVSITGLFPPDRLWAYCPVDIAGYFPVQSVWSVEPAIFIYLVSRCLEIYLHFQVCLYGPMLKTRYSLTHFSYRAPHLKSVAKNCIKKRHNDQE